MYRTTTNVVIDSMKRMPIALALVAALIVFGGCNQPESGSTAGSGQETISQADGTAPVMTMDDIAYMQTSDKPFGDLVAAIEAAAAENKFMVLQKHDLQESLTKKGFEMTPYTIIEVCNGKFAHTILSDTKEAGMFLPCRIAVYEADGTNHVVMMKPSLIGTMMPDADFGTIPEDVETILKNVIDTAVK